MKKLGLDAKVLLRIFSSSFSSERRGICKTASSYYICRSKSQLQGCLKVKLNFAEPLSYCNCFSRGAICYSPSVTARHYVTQESAPPEPKPSLYQRFKTMYRNYWYVLLPVHLVTSAAWFGGFYYLASSGVDIVALLESLNVSEKLINPLRNGHATTGYIAISYALYKIATPLRYTVTLGGTTVSINYLKRWGYIKPVPSTEKLKEIYEDKKVIFKEKGQTLKDNMMQTFKPTPNFALPACHCSMIGLLKETITLSPSCRCYVTKNECKQPDSFYKRTKAMFKEFWYVIIPVHLISSVIWLGVFYCVASSEADLVKLLERLNMSETIVNYIREHISAGHLAICLAMYKITTPLRYGITLGVTTIVINYLKKKGYIKPLPCRKEIK